MKNNNDRTKYLFKNTTILFLSNFSSKILVFFLLPLYTSTLTTAEYGISDLIQNTVDLLYIFLTFYIGSGILRFTMDETEDKNELFSIGIVATIYSFILVCLGSFISKSLGLFPSINGYYTYLCAIYLLYCVHSVLAAYAKGKDLIYLIGIAGIASTITQVTCNLLFLLVFKLGIYGYLISIVASYIVSCFVFLFGGTLKHTKLFLPRRDTYLRIIKYSIPIAATELGWLICTSSDKYIVAYMLGDSATGIISAAHRLPIILSAFTSIFIQAWQLSAIKEHSSTDRTEYYSKMYNYYNAFAVCTGAFLILASKLLGSFLYKADFSIAWIYTPIYITALVINTNSSFTGSILSANKKTTYLFTSTIVGAIINIVLDIILVKYIGIFGAGIATALSYVVISVMRVNAVKKHNPIAIEKIRFYISYILLFVLTATMIFSDNMIVLLASVCLFIGIIVINFSKIKTISVSIFSLFKKIIKRN